MCNPQDIELLILDRRKIVIEAMVKGETDTDHAEESGQMRYGKVYRLKLMVRRRCAVYCLELISTLAGHGSQKEGSSQIHSICCLLFIGRVA